MFALIPAALVGLSLCQTEGLTPVEVAAGWRDYTASPQAAALWRGYKATSFPAKGWTLKDGVLSVKAGSGGGDLVTVDEFGDFEMVFQFRLPAKANSGVIYRVGETLDASWMTGPEYQVLEDVTYGVKSTDMHAAGALYDLYAPAEGKTMKIAGAWNEGRIYLRNGEIQHWLNGKKLVDATIFDRDGKPTKEWTDKIAASKFKEYQGFGVLPKGRIALQEHGDEAAYRGIRIRALDQPLPAEVKLFNGKDLEGWEAFVPEAEKAGIKAAEVWHVEGDVLVCKGKPNGYIRTKANYTNYILKLEWRFNPVTKQAGNSGVLLRVTGPDKVWPRGVEAQLQSGRAGDFWIIDGYPMTTNAKRITGRNAQRDHGAERPVGEWNEYEITVHDGDIVLKVNGEEVNRATGAQMVAGKIALQSEGSEIHFRNIRLAPLP